MKSEFFRKSKLKKRLRKKFHLAEFQELGFKIIVKFNKNLNEQDFDDFTTKFLLFLENRSLSFGGGGDPKSWEGFITASEKFRSPAESDRNELKSWLQSQTEVDFGEIGKLKDAWYD